MLKEKARMEEARRRQAATLKMEGASAKSILTVRGPKVDLMLKARAQEIFEQQDADHSGTLDASEMQAVMRLLGYGDIERSKIVKHLAKFDDDGNGVLEFDEFFNLFLDLRAVAQKASLRREQSVRAIGEQAADADDRVESSSRGAMSGLKANCANGCIIHPTHNSWNGAWDLFVTAMLVLTLTTLPMAMAFEEVYKALFVPNLLIDVLFCTDIVKNFFTGYGTLRLRHATLVTLA